MDERRSDEDQQPDRGNLFFDLGYRRGARSGEANYNIHSYGHYKLKPYRIASRDFCDDFRAAFKRLRKSWPNVSTEFGSQTLMEGWFKINARTFTRDVVKLMEQFKDVATIIDELLMARMKDRNRARAAIG